MEEYFLSDTNENLTNWERDAEKNSYEKIKDVIKDKRCKNGNLVNPGSVAKIIN